MSDLRTKEQAVRLARMMADPGWQATVFWMMAYPATVPDRDRPAVIRAFEALGRWLAEAEALASPPPRRGPVARTETPARGSAEAKYTPAMPGRGKKDEAREPC